jgi:heme/copper-type cytochrome/quinol oxidase subunit 4
MPESMEADMSTAMWFVFAIVVLELCALGCLWILYVIHEHAAARHQPPHEHPGAPTATPPAA